MLKRHFAIINCFRVLVDILAISTLWNFAYLLRFHAGFFEHSGIPSYSRHLMLTFPVVIIIYLCRLWTGVYQSIRIESALLIFRKQVESILLGNMFLVFFLYYTEKIPYTRVLLILFFFLLLAGLLISHLLLLFMLRYIRSKGYNLRHYAIIGTGRTAIKLLRDIEQCSHLGLRCAFLIDDKPGLEGKNIRNIPVYGKIDNLCDLAKNHGLDEVYLAKSGRNARKIYPLLEALQCNGITVRIVPDWTGLTTISKPTIIAIGSSLLFNASDSPLTGLNHILKDISDRLVAMILLTLLSIPMLIIAILLKVSSREPVLYKQKRIGMNQKAFEILKFRTMKSDNKQTPGWSTPNDPRRTKIGSFLRSTSLDELPQLINVLKGEMSLVGPRPEQPYYVEKFSDEYKKYMFRHKVKAGMTGWAQIHGFRGDTSLRKRIQYDINYIQNWSLWLDLLILIRTPFHILKGENAN